MGGNGAHEDVVPFGVRWYELFSDVPLHGRGAKAGLELEEFVDVG